MDRVSACVSRITLGVLRPLGGWIDVMTTALREEDLRVDSKLVRVGSVVLGTRRVYAPSLTSAKIHVVGKRRLCVMLNGVGIV